MLDFIKSAYRIFFEIWLWINLIGCTITGAKLGGNMSSGDNHSDFVFYGIVIGAFVGISIDVLVGGLIATFLNIDKNIEYLIVGSEGSYGKTNNNKSTGDSETDEVIAYWERESKAKNRGGSSS